MWIDLLWLIACGGGPGTAESAPPVVCVPIESGTGVEHLSIRGPVRPPPDRDARVTAQVGGAIRAIHVREGDPVDVGARLVDLDDRTLVDAVSAARAALGSAEAHASQVRQAATRKDALLNRGIVSRADAQAADADAAQADSDLAKARTALSGARADLDRAHPTSPIAGKVLAIHGRIGEVVDPAAPLVDVVDPSVLELVATVGVADLARLEVGQDAELSVEGLGPAPGSVSAVAPGVDAATGLGTVRIRLDDPEALPVGAIATAQVDVGRHVGLLVPISAVRNGASGHEVVLCDAGVARTVPVEVGERTDDRVEVRGELSGTARVLFDAALPVNDGDAIEEAR